MHTRLLPCEAEPLRHARQPPVAGVGATIPGWQGRHCGVARPAYCPGAHAEHCRVLLEAGGEMAPVAQGRQLLGREERVRLL